LQASGVWNWLQVLQDWLFFGLVWYLAMPWENLAPAVAETAPIVPAASAARPMNLRLEMGRVWKRAPLVISASSRSATLEKG
jgi:hypothetical protein